MRLGLNLHLYPSAMVGESRLIRMARSLQEDLEFSESHLVGRSGSGLDQLELVAEGVFVRRLNVPLATSTGFVGKLVRTLMWYIRVWQTYARRDCASIAAHSVWTLPVAWLLAHRTGAILVYNPHEYESGTPNVEGFPSKIVVLLERLLVPRAAVFSVVNRSIREAYRSRLSSVEPIAVRNLPSIVDLRDGIDLRVVTGIADDRRLFVHTGNLVPGRNIPLLVDVFARCPEFGDIVFVGDGPLRTLTDSAAARFPNVHRVPAVSPSHIVRTISSADAAFCLIETDSSSYSMSSPNKLFEALAAGVPVICSDLNEARNLLSPVWSDWSVVNPEEDLEGYLRRLSWSHFDRFKAAMNRLDTWEDEVSPLLDAYRCSLEESPRR